MKDKTCLRVTAHPSHSTSAFFSEQGQCDNGHGADNHAEWAPNAGLTPVLGQRAGSQTIIAMWQGSQKEKSGELTE